MLCLCKHGTSGCDYEISVQQFASRVQVKSNVFVPLAVGTLFRLSHSNKVTVLEIVGEQDHADGRYYWAHIVEGSVDIISCTQANMSGWRVQNDR